MNNISNFKVHLVNLILDKGECWHYVAIPKIKLPLFAKFNKGEHIKLSDIGEVLKSGWGKEPPMKVQIEMKLKYDI